MNILITGGTGLIGSTLIKNLGDEHSFTVISRSEAKAKQTLGAHTNVLNSVSDVKDIGVFDAVINLAGEPIADKRWTDTQKKIICDSRWDITTQLVAKINSSDNPPTTFISGSAIGFYGRQGDKVVTEDSSPHEEFTHYLCEKWENIATGVDASKTRVIILRTGVVLAEDGGALEKMALPFKLGVGGSLGNGSQYLSWIHIDDMVNAIEFLLNDKNCSGPFNLTAPEPVTNKTFSKQLAKALSRPCLFFVPNFVMKIAMGESSTMLLEGQNVIPDKLIKAGYSFTYPTVSSALGAIYR